MVREWPSAEAIEQVYGIRTLRSIVAATVGQYPLMKVAMHASAPTCPTTSHAECAAG